MSNKGRDVSAPDMKARLGRLRRGLDEAALDGVLLTDMKSIRHLTGFTGSSGYAVITGSKAFFLTDSRYGVQAGTEVKGYSVRIYKKALEAVAALAGRLKIKAFGFESDSLSYGAYLKLKKALPGVRLRPAGGIAGKGRLVKDPFEVERIRDSVRILDSGYRLAERILRPGVIEKKAAVEIEFAFRKAGADGLAFDTIIASGWRGALPHGKASEKALKKGELVVVDMGVCKDGYNSDETRTFSIGRPSSLQREVYEVVREAQALALGRVRPGVAASEVDKAARDFIRKAGYGKCFGHGTGHGVGLDIHEGPTVGPMSGDELQEGMVITVEPGIYLSGRFGVRIEDMALVVKGGCEILTKTPREIVCL